MALVAIALFLRILIPPGFMPAPGVSGGFPIILCTGEGMAAGWVDEAGQFHEGEKPQSGPGKSTGEHCPFASAAGDWTIDELPGEPAHIGFWQFHSAQPLDEAATTSVALPPPARGPPISA